jgi:hypothetical protein
MFKEWNNAAAPYAKIETFALHWTKKL